MKKKAKGAGRRLLAFYALCGEAEVSGRDLLGACGANAALLSLRIIELGSFSS
jgi:hypothetical protein